MLFVSTLTGGDLDLDCLARPNSSTDVNVIVVLRFRSKHCLLLFVSTVTGGDLDRLALPNSSTGVAMSAVGRSIGRRSAVGRSKVCSPVNTFKYSSSSSAYSFGMMPHPSRKSVQHHKVSSVLLHETYGIWCSSDQ